MIKLTIECYQFDNDGFILGVVSIDEDELNSRGDVTTTPPPDNLYKPKFENGNWVEGLSTEEILQLVKDRKIQELKAKCTEAIYYGFVSTLSNTDGVFYEFGFNYKDQLNFNSRLNMINSWKNQLRDGVITQEEYDSNFPLYWKTKNLGVVSITEQEFYQILKDAEAHFLTQQTKYWQLESQVLSATTIEDIEIIEW